MPVRRSIRTRRASWPRGGRDPSSSRPSAWRRCVRGSSASSPSASLSSWCDRSSRRRRGAPSSTRWRRRWATSRREAGMTIASSVIPVIDLGPFLADAPGAFGATATQVGRALEDVGFFVIVNHGVAQALIDRTFAEARRFHGQPMEAKLALRMNEHNNGYMMLGRYAVWTSDVNANDKPDLNEAFFIKRERRPDDPLVRAGRRFAGPNQWPQDLPGFREAMLRYTDAVDALGRRVLPLCATALDLPIDTF